MDQKNQSPHVEGSGVGDGGQAKPTAQRKKRFCSDDHIKNVVREIRAAGLQLRSTDGDTQLATLPKVLHYLGERGLNTYEGTALGYLRIATRILDLKESWEIRTLREDVVGPDGLWHKGVARYFIVGKRQDLPLVQPELDLGSPA